MTGDGQLTGGCNCGAVRYRIGAPPIAVVACHCTQCRKQSGATYSVNLIVEAERMEIDGSLAVWEDRETDSGAVMRREFCSACGSPIRSVPRDSMFVAVKAGTLDAPNDHAPMLHIWTQSKLAWVVIPAGLPTFDKAPA
jgi:hypothetical protein